MNTTINNTNFKSGLNSKILFKEKLIIPKKQEKIFMDRYGTEACFAENKSAALANRICADIFVKLATGLKKILTFPPAIIIYDRKNLTDNNSTSNFCIPDTKEVLNNDYPFLGRSVFFEQFKNLSYINDITEFQFKNKKTSSSHFLAPFIHEWLHSFQLDYIYKQFGYGGKCDYLQEIYPTKEKRKNGYMLLKELQNKQLSTKENEIIYEELGEYATLPQNQYLEIFSESFTKFICNSLAGNSIIKNPIEELSKTKKEFQDILHKVCSFDKTNLDKY